MPVIIDLPKKQEQEAENGVKSYDRLINNITFFGDSALPDNNPHYKEVHDLAKLLAENKFTIVNGGGPGIMKAATDGAESVNGRTIAVYWQPKLATYFEGKNLANVTDETATSSNYVMRTFELIEKGDAYVVCKGGTGTISEFGLVWCLAKLYYGCHKPVILFGDFWDELIVAIQKAMYIDETELGVLYRATKAEDVLRIIEEHELKIQSCRFQTSTTDEAAFMIRPRTAELKKQYDRIASSYHSEHAGKLVAQEQLDEFMTLVNTPAQVFDIGCGPGFDVRYLSEKYNVSGIDLSAKFVDIARFENPNSKIVLGDIVDYEMATEKYKGVWARDSLHHITEENLDGVFKKVYDALVEGGIFYVIVREGEGEIVETEERGYSKLQRFYHLFSEEELTARGVKAGFKLKKIDHTQRSHKWIVGVFQK